MRPLRRPRLHFPGRARREISLHRLRIRVSGVPIMNPGGKELAVCTIPSLPLGGRTCPDVTGTDGPAKPW